MDEEKDFYNYVFWFIKKGYLQLTNGCDSIKELREMITKYYSKDPFSEYDIEDIISLMKKNRCTVISITFYNPTEDVVLDIQLDNMQFEKRE